MAKRVRKDASKRVTQKVIRASPAKKGRARARNDEDDLEAKLARLDQEAALGEDETADDEEEEGE